MLGGLWGQRCGESEFWSFCERESVEDFGTGDDKEGCGGCIPAVATEELGGFGSMSLQTGAPKVAQEPYLLIR